MSHCVDAQDSPLTQRDLVPATLPLAHQWSLKDAINAYYEMKGIGLGHESDCSISTTSIPASRAHLGLGLDVHKNGPLSLVAKSEAYSGSTNGLKCLSEPSLSSPTSPHPDSTEDSTCSSPSKLAVSKMDVNDAMLDGLYPKKLVRGISRATVRLLCS